MSKPVIILGGGLWGSLLAYRLKEALPLVDFILYEESSTLGRHEMWSFRESDCGRALNWLRPLVTKSWRQHKVKFKSGERDIMTPYHLLDSKKLHDHLVQKLPTGSLKLNNQISTELALQEGSFVIDTRNICHYRKTGYRKCLSLEVECLEDHGVETPVLYNEEVRQKDCPRNLYYLPLSPRNLIIKDFWYSNDKNLNLDEMRRALSETLASFGWKIHKIIKEETSVTLLPTSRPVFRQEGRVINLAGIFHDTTGCEVGSAAKLIDRMINTSFRFGELREVVASYRNEIESDRKFLRLLNRLLIEEKQRRIFEVIYQKANLNLFDRSRILMWKLISV